MTNLLIRDISTDILNGLKEISLQQGVSVAAHMRSLAEREVRAHKRRKLVERINRLRESGTPLREGESVSLIRQIRDAE